MEFPGQCRTPSRGWDGAGGVSAGRVWTKPWHSLQVSLVQKMLSGRELGSDNDISGNQAGGSWAAKPSSCDCYSHIVIS